MNITKIGTNRNHQAPAALRGKIFAEWKPSLVIAAIYLASSILGDQLNWRSILSTVMFFCMSLIGLAVARQIYQFKPLPIVNSIRRHEHPWRSVALMFAIALVIAPFGLLVTSLGNSLGQQILDETIPDLSITSVIPSNPVKAFFAFLAGSGIAEETIFRLVLLSILWRWTKRPWLAIVLSSLIFGVYHLTPLNRMYLYFWEFPFSQLIGATLGGLVSGWLYMKRGYETVVLEHTLENWIPFALFVLLAN